MRESGPDSDLKLGLGQTFLTQHIPVPTASRSLFKQGGPALEWGDVGSCDADSTKMG